MEATKDLKDVMRAALDSGKMLVTISYKKGEAPNDLHHYWFTKDYPKNELMNTLNHVKDEIANRELREEKKDVDTSKPETPKDDSAAWM